MINPHESMGPGRDRTCDPWICSQTRICCQTRYRLRYAARYDDDDDDDNDDDDDDVLSVLIWVQTVCKGYQQMTKVPASKKS